MSLAPSSGIGYNGAYGRSTVIGVNGSSHTGGGGPHAHTGRSSVARHRLILTLLTTAGIFVAEVVGGLLSGSLALLSDAGHMLTDMMALLLSLFALILSTRPADSKRTYGYYRVEIIASFLNGLLLISLSGGLLYSAWLRFQHPRPVEGGIMMVFALIGLAGNVLGAILLMNLRDNINLRAAFLHVVSDGVSSVGVLLGSFLIYYRQMYVVDVVLGVLIALFIIYNSLRLLHEATNVLLESTPPGIDIAAVRAALLAIPCITAVHDLHIWSISTDIPALSAHIVVSDSDSAYTHQILKDVHATLERDFRLSHSTVQIENESFRSRCGSDRREGSCAS